MLNTAYWLIEDDRDKLVCGSKVVESDPEDYEDEMDKLKFRPQEVTLGAYIVRWSLGHWFVAVRTASK